jgi:hypothetical protein
MLRTMTDEPPSVPYMIARAVLTEVPFGSALDVLVEGTRQRLAYKARRTVAEVAEATGVEALAERLASDPEVEALFVQGLDAATQTGYEEKRRLLARLISAAVLDDAKVDESLLFVLALRDLDGPHLRALERLRRAQDEAAETYESEPDLKLDKQKQRRASLMQVAVHSAAAKEHEAVLAALVKWDVARIMVRSWGGAEIIGEVSPFGLALLDHIREVQVVAESGD